MHSTQNVTHFRGETDCTPFIDPPLDFVLAVECIYLEDLFEPLLQTLEHLAGPDTTIFVSFIKRRSADGRFWKKAQKKFDWKKVMIYASYIDHFQVPSTYFSNNEHDQAQIYTMKKKQKK
jgi:hypothetical protein